MRFFQTILIGLIALIAAGCSGGPSSPDFTPVLQQLRIAPLSATVPIGGTAQFQAIGVYSTPPGSDETSQERVVGNVDWTVDNTNASVDGDGLATGLVAGTAQIRARADGIDAAPATLTITPATLQSIAIDPLAVTVPLGDVQVFTATGTFSDGTSTPVSATWTSSNTAIATVIAGPATSTTATTVATGVTTITATVGDQQANAQLTVGPATPVPVSISIDPATATIPLGTNQVFTATGVFSDGTTGAVSATWLSSNQATATVLAGPSTTTTATSLATGTTTITATVGTLQATALLTVGPSGPSLVSIAIDPATATIPLGTTQVFTATGTFSDGTTGSVSATWTSSNQATATVLAGPATTTTATSVAEGTTTITATVGTVQQTAQLTVGPAAGPALVSIAIAPPSTTIPLGSTQLFTATGTFANGTTGTVSATWTSSNQAVATVLEGPATTTTATSVAQGTTTITATVGTVQGTAQLTVGAFAPRLVSITVAPNPGSSPVGRPLQFVASGECTTAAFSVVTAPCAPTGVVWAVATPGVATIDATTGVARGLIVGSTQVTATSGTVVGSAAFNVTPAVIGSLVVAPATASVAVGASQRFDVTAVFTDGSTGPVVVDWSSSAPAIATVAPTPAAFTSATGVSPGQATIVATTTNALNEVISSGVNSGTLTVTGAVLTDLVEIRPPTGRVTPGRVFDFDAFGVFSDSAVPVQIDSLVNWTSSNPAIATVDAAGRATGVTQGVVTITAARQTDPTDSATATLTVTDVVCTTPLLQSEGATAVEFASPLCVGCTVDNEGNIIDANTQNFATASTIVGLLGANVGVTVAPGPAGPARPYAVPFPAGSNAGFIIGKPAGTLLTAEVLSQVQVSTLRNGVVQQTSSSGVTPLRLDLLGLQLLGGFDTALVSIGTTVDYDAIRLTVNSGTASALSTVQIFQACATAEPPAPAAALTGVTRVDLDTSSLSVDGTTGAVLIGTYSDGSQAPIPDADVNWTSSATGVATVDANGLVTGVAPGTATITGTLKTGVSPGVGARSASSMVTVVGNLCSTPLLAPTANVAESSSLLCLLCSVSNTPNIVDASNSTFGTINVPLGLLGGTASVTVSSNSAPVTPGAPAGFLISRPVGQLLQAEVLSQIQVSTLLGGVVQQTSGPTIPLRADLLGLALLGGTGNQALVSIQPTQPFDALRLTFVSGVATVGLLENTLQTVNVFQACSALTLPAL